MHGSIARGFGEATDLSRLVGQGSVQLHGEKITDPKATPALNPGDVLRLDKKHAVRVAG
jgi:tyrosyl-tRNA synthetase